MEDLTFDEFETALVAEVMARSDVDFFDVLGDAPTRDFYDDGLTVSESADRVMELLAEVM